MSSADLSKLRIDRGPRSGPPPRSRRLVVGGALALVAVIALIAALVTREPVYDVRVASAALRGGATGAGGLTANGYVVARTKASISSKIPGRLAFLGVEEGDRVTAGTVIARLESSEYESLASQARAEVANAQAAVHEADAALAQALRAVTRARILADSGLIAPQAREDAETAVSVTQARLEAARARLAATRHAQAAAEATLENTRVRAPFSGTVLRKDAEVGEVVAPSVAGGGLTRGAVVTIADLSTLEVEVDVNEAYIAGIRPEQPALIVLDAYPAEAFPGRVRQVVPTADRQKATVLVRVAIDSNDPRILPEMGARVVFRDDADATPAGPAPARVFVPAETVRTEGDRTVVFVVRDERVARVPVEAAPVSGGEREVRSGLGGGEVLVLDPPPELEDGARVRVATSPNR